MSFWIRLRAPRVRCALTRRDTSANHQHSHQVRGDYTSVSSPSRLRRRMPPDRDSPKSPLRVAAEVFAIPQVGRVGSRIVKNGWFWSASPTQGLSSASEGHRNVATMRCGRGAVFVPGEQLPAGELLDAIVATIRDVDASAPIRTHP